MEVFENFGSSGRTRTYNPSVNRPHLLNARTGIKLKLQSRLLRWRPFPNLASAIYYKVARFIWARHGFEPRFTAPRGRCCTRSVKILNGTGAGGGLAVGMRTNE